MPMTESEKIWMDGELVDWDDAKIHVLTHTLHYGCGVFEGIRAYETTQGPAVFRLTDHIVRLFDSAKIFMIDIPFSVEQLVEATKETVRVNGLHVLLHPPDRVPRLRRDGAQPAAVPGERLHRGVAVGHLPRRRGHQARRADEDQLVAAPRPQRHAAGGQGHRHVHQLVDGQGRGAQGRLRRGDPAVAAGLRERVHGREHLHRQATARSSRRPCRAGALEGITQDSVRTIARDLGYRVPRSATSCAATCTPADEAFLSGTAAEVVPIRSVDDREIGEPGPDHPQDPGDLLRRRPRRGRPVQGLDRTCQRRDVRAVEIYDTTLRDGSQLEGISLTVDDKLRIAEQLDHLGVHYIEGGWPGANPKDDEFFQRAPDRARPRRRRRWWRSGRPGACKGKVDDDDTLRHLVEADTSTVCIVGKCWDYHVTEALRTDARRRRGHGGRLGRVPARRTACECFFDAEHFFDGYKRNPEFSLRVLEAAADRRARLASCCATPTAARCRTRSSASSARSSRTSAATSPSACTCTTTPAAAWPTRSPACAAAPARCRARSTATASAPATATSPRSSRTSR